MAGVLMVTVHRISGGMRYLSAHSLKADGVEVAVVARVRPNARRWMIRVVTDRAAGVTVRQRRTFPTLGLAVAHVRRLVDEGRIVLA